MQVLKYFCLVGIFFLEISHCASFNCYQAKTDLENVICSNEQLGKLDTEMSDYYFKIKNSLTASESKDFLYSQRIWLSNITKQCKSSETDCLNKIYRKRIFELRKMYENIAQINSLDDKYNINGCNFNEIVFPTNMLIYAAGAYSGKKTNYQIDQSGHAATQFDVIINSPEYPVSLILGAYEPSIWNISFTEGTKIESVYLSGYHKQAIVGLSKHIPIINNSFSDNGKCGYFYVSEDNLKKINPLANSVYGKNVKMVYYVNNGNILIGEPLPKNARLYNSKDNPLESIIDRSKPLAGQAGLEDLLAKGMLRRSTSNDIEKWAKLNEEAYINKLKETNEELPPVANAKKNSFKPQYVINGFVILKKITIPAGLYGGNLATFFLDKGVPYPDGQLGHSTLYDFNTIRCIGVACPHEQ